MTLSILVGFALQFCLSTMKFYTNLQIRLRTQTKESNLEASPYV